MGWFDDNTGFTGGMDRTGGFETVPSVGTGQAGLPRDAGASVNQNPLFNPNQNITPGKDIPLAGGAAPAGTAAPPATGTGPQNGDWQGWFQSLTNGKPPTPDQLVALEAQINAAGGKVLRNASGVAGKIQLPGGQIIDVIQGAGTGGHAWQWLTGDASGGASGGSLGSLGQGFGGLTAPFTGQFSAPSAAEAQAMPGFQFALDKGLNAVDRGAASKGTLLTGGNVKDRIDYATGMASQNYNNVFNQSLATFGTNRDTFYHNQDSPYNKYLNLAQLGKPTTP